MKQHFFLDLEGTIIDSWDNRVFVNYSRVKDFLSQRMIKEVNIFSFAIWNEKDLNVFNQKDFKGWLEDALEVKIVSTPTVEDIKKVVQHHRGINWETHELISVWGKLRSFQDFCIACFENCSCTLLDDAVPNMTQVMHDSNLVIKTIDVETI